jgi:hypothetical protein
MRHWNLSSQFRGNAVMTANKPTATAKAIADDRQQGYRKFWLVTLCCGFAVTALAVLTLAA